MMMHLRTLTLTLLGSIPILPAQTATDGYGLESSVLPGAISTPLLLPDLAARVWFDGQRLLLVPDDGGPARTLLDLGGPKFASFAERVGRGRLVFGESSDGGIWSVPLDPGSAPELLTSLTFNFSATPLDDDHVLVSAKTGGFADPDNDLFAVSLRDGSTDLLARVPGASGALARDQRGRIFYATASNDFPAPPGATSIYRFTRDALAAGFGPGAVDLSVGTVVATGLDSAGSLVVDDEGDLFVTDFVSNSVLEVDTGIGASGAAEVLVRFDGALSPAGLQLVRSRDGDRRATFEPFQPEGHERLAILATDFFSTSELLQVTPRRASLRGEIGDRRVTLISEAGPSGQQALLFLRLGRTWSSETSLQFPGLDQPLFWGLGFGFARLAGVAEFDAGGAAAMEIRVPRLPFTVPVRAQALWLDFEQPAVGSSETLDLQLGGIRPYRR